MQRDDSVGKGEPLPIGGAHSDAVYRRVRREGRDLIDALLGHLGHRYGGNETHRELPASEIVEPEARLEQSHWRVREVLAVRDRLQANVHHGGGKRVPQKLRSGLGVRRTELSTGTLRALVAKLRVR